MKLTIEGKLPLQHVIDGLKGLGKGLKITIEDFAVGNSTKTTTKHFSRKYASNGPRRELSAKARKAISLAQKARWAKFHKNNK